MDNPAKTPTARHQNVVLHNTFPPWSHSAPKPLTATLMQEVIAMHEKFLKVYLQVAPDWVLTYGKSKFVLKYGKGKGMPSCFSHFYCHRAVLSTQKNFKGFFNISGRLGEVQPLKILLAAHSFNLSGPPKIRTISGPCHLYFIHIPFVVNRTFTLRLKEAATLAAR